jgi:HPt (histidine-containing phosphotransfer) domain-containing protein
VRAGYVGMIDKPVLGELLRERLQGGATAAVPAEPSAEVAGPAATEAALPAALRALTAVPGLDVERGLRSVRGDAQAYLRLLHSFAQFHADDAALLRSAAARGDAAALQARAHSLKSATGTVGALGLQALAQPLSQHGLTLDAATTDTARELAGGLEALVQSLREVMPSLPHPPGAPSATGAGAPAAPQARAQRQALRQSLQQRNMDALRWLQTVSDTELAALGVPAAALRRAVMAFDYDTALRLLDEAEASLPH